MTPATFCQHFQTLAEAPNAVAKLRDMILQMAVRGNLVLHDSDDEPASALLRRIEDRRSALIEADDLREPKKATPFNPDFLPFELPPNWQWIQLGSVMRKMGAGSTPLGGKRVYVDDGVMFLRSQNVWNHGLLLDDVARIDPATHEQMSGTSVQPGDVLLNITGASIGRCALVPDVFDAANVSQHVAILRLIDKHLRHFLHLCVISPFFQDTIMRVQVGVSREGLAMTRLREFPFPVPPLAEQRRIVAKVDELMVLCDELEGRVERQQEARERLSAAALDRLLAARDPAEVARRWQRICDHFDLLYDAPETLTQLRQAILQLAVQGGLVPQDHNEEPAAAQLAVSDSIRQEIAAKDRRADAELQTMLAAEEKWPTPSTWEWRGLADLVLFIDYRGQTPQKVKAGIRLITAKNVRKGFVNPLPEEFVTEATYRTWMTRGFPREGDVLFTTEAPMGNAAVVRQTDRFALAQRVINFRPFGAVAPDFLVLQLLSSPFQAILEKTATGLTAKGIKAAKLKRLPIAVPPLAEQRRIVAKVDHLMSLCDALEAKLKQSQTDSQRLLAAAVHHLLANGAGSPTS